MANLSDSLQGFFGLLPQTEMISTPPALFIAAVRWRWCVWGEGCCDLSGETRLAGPDDDAASWAVPIRTGLSRVNQWPKCIFDSKTCVSGNHNSSLRLKVLGVDHIFSPNFLLLLLSAWTSGTRIHCHNDWPLCSALLHLRKYENPLIFFLQQKQKWYSSRVMFVGSLS